MEEEDINPTVKVPRIKPAPPSDPNSGHTTPLPASAPENGAPSEHAPPAIPTQRDDSAAASVPPVVEAPPWLRMAQDGPAASATETPAASAPRATPAPVAAPSWLQYIGAAEPPAPSTGASSWAEIVPSLPASVPVDEPPRPAASYPAARPQQDLPLPAPPPRSFAFDATTMPSMPAVSASHPAPDHTAEDEENMANTQWEYCRIQLDSGSYGQKQTIGRYPYFVRVTLDYYGADYVGTEVFGEDTDQIERPNKMWGQILGLMGMANWELVNVFTGPTKDLALVNVMAYMKRPVQPGRRVNEPKIVL